MHQFFVLIGDAVIAAVNGQTVAAGCSDAQVMLTRPIKRAAAVGVCGASMHARGVLPRMQKLVKLTCNSTVYRPEALMGHSQMLDTRRRQQKAKKHLARMARRAKKLREKNAKPAGADALQKGSA
jgi:hypothetical protein